MKEYIGTKRILATPMNRREWCRYRDWDLPANENGDDEGFLVEYLDSVGQDMRHTGYISWTPAAEFHRAYQPQSRMTFGHAIEMLKAGYAVARAGWNGKGMFVWLNKGSHPHQPLTTHGGIPGSLFDYGDRGTIVRMPNFNMRTPDGSTVTGWLASQTDMLAEDWSVVSITPQA